MQENNRMEHLQPTDTRSNYAKLNGALALYENAVANPWPTVPPTQKLLKVGSKGYSIFLLRERLRRTNDLLPENDQGGEKFDRNLADAVKTFQIRHGLKADGVVGNATIAELNVPPEERVKEIRMNMARWENLESRLGNRYILVNIPDYQLHLVDNGMEILNMKVIVGRPQRPTPEVVSTVTTIVFNPYWNVPEKIANKDIVPKAKENLAYLDEEQIKIYDGQDRNAQEIDPRDIDWSSAQQRGFKYHFRQDPGDKMP